MKKAVSVFSGGLDCTVATCINDRDYDIHAITFDYSQKAVKAEIRASQKICEKMGWSHEVIDLKWLSKISTSSLNTSDEIPELTEEDLNSPEKTNETAENVWVPARNTVFTSIALAYAESMGAEIIIVGWNGEEGETFPDNSKEYAEKFNDLIEVGSPDNIKIEAPCIDWDKEEIVKKGIELGAPIELSYSCYRGSENPCGVCESCVRRKRALKKFSHIF